MICTRLRPLRSPPFGAFPFDAAKVGVFLIANKLFGIIIGLEAFHKSLAKLNSVKLDKGCFYTLIPKGRKAKIR